MEFLISLKIVNILKKVAVAFDTIEWESGADNVFLLRHTKRLPFEKRSVYAEVKRQHDSYPIDAEVVWRFVNELQGFVDAVWYDPQKALQRGSFI